MQVGPTSSGVVPQKSVINLYPYIEKLSEIIRKYKSKYRSYDFDVIFAAQIQGRGAFLEYIDDTGLPSDIYDSYKILGTGDIVTNAFLKSMWSKKMTMNDFTELVPKVENLIEPLRNGCYGYFLFLYVVVHENFNLLTF